MVVLLGCRRSVIDAPATDALVSDCRGSTIFTIVGRSWGSHSVSERWNDKLLLEWRLLVQIFLAAYLPSLRHEHFFNPFWFLCVHWL